MRGKLSWTALVVLCFQTCCGQSIGDALWTQTQEIERLVEDAMGERREAYLVEHLTRLREEPLDLNSASCEELAQVPGLDMILAQRIAEFRSRSQVATLSDLLQIDGIDERTLSVIRPFVEIRESAREAVRVFSAVKVRTRVARSTSDARETLASGYLGSPERLYSRITARLTGVLPEKKEPHPRERGGSSLALGILTEKDPGERNMVDFISAYADISLPGQGLRFILGDFGTDAALGEVFSSSGGYGGRTSIPENASLRREGIRASLASETSENWRGIAASWQNRPFFLMTFLSIRPRDASIDSNGAVRTWDVDGYHRSERELLNKHSVREKAIGTRAIIRVADALAFGASWYGLTVDRDGARTSDQAIDLRGTHVGSIDVAFTYGPSSLFAEIAQRFGRLNSCVVSYRWTPTKILTASLLVRLNKEENASEAKVIAGHSGNISNSSGVTCALRFSPAPSMKISALFDQYRIPDHATTNVLPASGYELALRAEWDATSAMTIEFRYRQRRMPTPETLIYGGSLEATVDGATMHSDARLSMSVHVGERAHSRSRLDIVEVRRHFSSETERGMMMYHDWSFEPLQGLSLSLRAIAFETSSFFSRISEFEEDLPGTFQNPALYGRGFRWFIRSEVVLWRGMRFSARYARTDARPVVRPEDIPEASQFRCDERWSIQLDLSW